MDRWRGLINVSLFGWTGVVYFSYFFTFSIWRGWGGGEGEGRRPVTASHHCQRPISNEVKDDCSYQLIAVLQIHSKNDGTHII